MPEETKHPERDNGLRRLVGLLAIIALLASPIAGQHYAYIPNMGFEDEVQDDLSIIDLATNTVVATVPVGHFPQGVAINPAGTACYVANTGDNSFTVIQIPSYTSTTIAGPGGTGATGVAVHPDGTRIYVANPEWYAGGVGSTVWVVDRATHAIIDEIACGAGSCGVAAHPDGKTVYVANALAGTIAVFDTQTHAVLDTITLETQGANERCFPVPIIVHPEGTFVYAANRQGPTFWAINTATHEVTAKPFGNTHVCIAIHPDGTAVYLPDVAGTTVDVIDARTFDLITTIEGMDGPRGVSVHPDCTCLYVVTQGTDAVAVLDAVTYAPIANVTVGTKPLAYGQFIGPGVPRLLKADAVARLQTAKDTIEGDVEGVISPQYAIDHLASAIESGNLSLQEDRWSASQAGQVDPRRLKASEGHQVFEAERAMVQAALDALRRGWIVNEQLHAELLSVVDEAVRADRVLAAVAIDDAVVAGADPQDVEAAQDRLKQGDALVKQAALWQNLDRKADLLGDAIESYEQAWSTAMTLLGQGAG